MRDYELMVVLDPNLEDSAVEALNTRIQTLVSQRGGSVESVDSWGRRRLAYPIGRYRDGIYVLTRMHLPPNTAAEIDRALNLTESVIRHRLFRADGLAPAGASATAATHA
ncbi:MAG: 30S ribosomal protein S6 [Chloroflexi bacterium]|nr:30S ribosomal protein S6 [Chloroflexota bacterium]MBV9544861.1 30S ribosomal protein S6 [Chloroflexota bacterium]